MWQEVPCGSVGSAHEERSRAASCALCCLWQEGAFPGRSWRGTWETLMKQRPVATVVEGSQPRRMLTSTSELSTWWRHVMNMKETFWWRSCWRKTSKRIICPFPAMRKTVPNVKRNALINMQWRITWSKPRWGKNFGCNICGEKRKRKSSLDLHLRQHTGTKNYMYNACHPFYSVNIGKSQDE